NKFLLLYLNPKRPTHLREPKEASLVVPQEGSRPRHHVTTLGDIDAQTRFETASKKSHDPPLLEVNTFGSEEDNMEHHADLTDFVPPTPHDSPLSGGHTPGSDGEEPRRATLPPIIQSQDKGKGKMVEPEPISKNSIKAQIQRDAEIAQRLFKEEQAQFERE
nr:hypothetical protein [Tanacetum cinerariifolium]